MHCRFVVNSLSKFDTSVPMISMTMAEFLQAARSDAKDTWAEGETQPIHRASQPAIPAAGAASLLILPAHRAHMPQHNVHFIVK